MAIGVDSFAAVSAATGTMAAYHLGWASSMTRIGRERGWPTATRQQFDAAVGPDGAFLMSGPETVAARILRARRF